LLSGFLTCIICFLILLCQFSSHPNTPQKAIIFLIESRLVLAAFLLISAYIYKDKFHELINRPVLLAIAIIFSAASLFSVLFYPEYLPAMYNPDNTLSNELVLALLITTVIILYASYLYAVRFCETGEKNLIFLIDGSVIIMVSNFVYFLCEFSGHFLIIAGFVFIHLAMYKSSVEHPYEKLATAEEKLRFAAEERYKNLFDNANDAIVTIDLEDKVTAWNKAAEKIFGWKAEEVMGKKLCSLIVPKELQAEREQLINKALSGVPVMWIESVCLRRDGGRIDVSLTISPILDARGKVTGFSGIIRDITERKRAKVMRI